MEEMHRAGWGKGVELWVLPPSPISTYSSTRMFSELVLLGLLQASSSGHDGSLTAFPDLLSSPEIRGWD